MSTTTDNALAQVERLFIENGQLREQVAKARIEGAREAWRIARNNAGATQFGDVDFSDARIIYRATFGEEAP